jgi:predicted ATPase
MRSVSEHAASSSITQTSVPSRSTDTFVVELDGEAVVLDEQANRLHLLNRTATLVWNCLDGEVDVAGLAREISEVLELPFEQVLAETLSVVSDLAAEGLLDGIPPEAP